MFNKKMKAGDVIETLDEMYSQRTVFWGDSKIGWGMFSKWSMKFARWQLAAGKIRYAVIS